MTFNKGRIIFKLFSFLMLVLFISHCQSIDGTMTEKKPNIIYILADDLGYGDLSCYGQTKFKTPHIDALATNGLKFTQHYSGSTVCAPSRCSLLTGLHTGHTQVRGNREVDPIGQSPIKADTLTFAKLLKKAGYVTGAFGKWGLGSPGSEGTPLKQGFDTFYGYNCQRNAHTYYPTWLYHDDKKITLDGQTYSHDLIMDKAMEFIKTNRDNSFFCFLPIAIPHAAMQIPKDKHDIWRKKFPQFDNVTSRYYKTKRTINNPIAAFAAMVTHMDEQIGEMMTLLKKLGIDDNTLVMFTSDNGPHKEGGHDPEFWNSNGPLKGHKRDLYEGGIRVPLIAHWPGKIKTGRVSDHPSAFWDMMPTFTQIAGIDAPENCDGISILPTLLGKKTQKKHEYLYWEFSPQGGKQAILKDNWKAIRLNVAENKKSKIQLYNLNKDIGENNNVADSQPQIVAEMKEIFKNARTVNKNFKLFK